MFKKSLFLLSLCILIQSCYSYKTVNYNHSEVKTTKKIKITTKDNQHIKGKIIRNNNTEIVVNPSKKSPSVTIPKSSIKKIQVRKFSYLKTAGTSLIGLSAALFAFAVNFNSN